MPVQASLDIAVVAVEVDPAPAGQPSDAQVTVANRGVRTLYPEDYLIVLEAPGSPEELRQNVCDGERAHVFIDAPVEIEPGRSEIVPVHHIFARAGTYPITARATLLLSEDGSTHDNTLTVMRTVPPSHCACGKLAC